MQKIPYLIAIAGMIAGVFIAILFGANEEMFKNKIKAGLEQNVKIQQMAEPERTAKLASEQDKNWRYYQRFHFHSTGIGAMSLALLIFLSFIAAPERIRAVTAYGTAIGGMLYPFVWLFSGIYGPSMGRSEAKEAFAVFGYMGGVFLLSTLAIFILALVYPNRLTRS